MKPLFFILLLALTSCDPKEDSRTLPPITTTGENTFGCYVNGIIGFDDTKNNLSYRLKE